MRMLYIGQFPPPIGGATIWSAKFCSSGIIRESFNKVYIINTSRKRLKPANYSSLFTFIEDIWILWKSIFQLLINLIFKKIDIVMFGLTDRGLVIQGLLLGLISKCFKKKIIIKIFGGSFDEYYKSLPSFLKKIVFFILKSIDIILPETDHLLSFFINAGIPENQIHKLPNFYLETEQVDLLKNLCNKNNKEVKFVYLSHVREEKGIFYLLDSVKMLFLDGITEFLVDIYGPIFGDIKEKFFDNLNIIPIPNKVNYKGIVPYEKVMSILKNYDVLIFPSYYLKEGHPGVLLEAMACGLAIIATNWKSLRELVHHNKNGILIPPKDSHSLKEAMKELILNEELLIKMQKESFVISKFYSDKYVLGKFVEKVRSLK